MAFDYFSASIPSAGASSHSSQPPKRPNGFDYYCVCAAVYVCAGARAL
jgi:hypothetical protein